MNDTEAVLQKTAAANAKKYHGRGKACGVLGWICLGVTVASLVGVIVTIIMLSLGKGDETLVTILAGCFFGTLVLFILLFLLCFKRQDIYAKRELDCEERARGAACFCVGEGTFATFEEHDLVIRGNNNRKQITVRVPYADMRFFSVCSRHKPEEKGEWSVVFEIPARYLAKHGKAKASDPPALIQTDAKSRLYDVLKQHSLTLLGELPVAEKQNTRFLREQHYVLPHASDRKKMITLMALGVLVLIGGIVFAVLSPENATAGAVVSVVGLYLLSHGFIGFRRARSVLGIYREGLYWKDRSPADSMFLKWDEIVSFHEEEKNGVPYLTLECLYGAYSVPSVGDAFECLKERFPEKCRK